MSTLLITETENKIWGVKCRELATTNLLLEGTPSILSYPPDRLSSVMVHLPAPAYGVYLSPLIRYSRACGSYQDFLDRGFQLTRKLLRPGFLLLKMKSSLRKFYGRHRAMVDRYGISVSQMTTDMFRLSQTLPCPFLIDDLSPGL
jgi:hypothetical protein